MLILVIATFILLMALGTPIAFAIGIASILTIVAAGNLPLLLVPHRLFTQLDSFTLLAVPFFILTGYLMESGGISTRLFGFANALTRHLRGGLAQATLGASVVMAGLSGSGVADISAIGAIAAPSMRQKGYRPSFIAAVLSAGGSLGPIIPPSILMIVYGSITGVSIGALFLAGVVPGLLMGGAFAFLIWLLAGSQQSSGDPRASVKEILHAFREAIWALIAPLIIVGGIVSGVFTATEAGAVAAVYAFLVGTLVYGELMPRDYFEILVRTAVTTGVVLIIIAAAGLFGWLLERMRFPAMVAHAVVSISDNPQVVLFLIIAFLIAIGTIVEILAAAIILIPVLDPIGVQLGFNPLHYAFVIVLALNVGSVTPPVGVYLYLANAIAESSLTDSIRALWPFLAVMLGVIILVAYVPQLALYLPGLIVQR
jgi:C4-dicarboxylate transporter DctM subunit